MAIVDDLKLLLPTGKSLETPTLEMFRKANIKIRRKHERSCEATVEGFPGISKAYFAKPSCIPGLIADGTGHIGITGKDAVFECHLNLTTLDKKPVYPFKTVAKFPYSRKTSGGTRCVLFARDSNPISSIEEIPQGAVIATEYPVSTMKILFRSGIRATLHECQGSAETYVVCGKFEYGVALVETGETLRANGLKAIGTVFESTTVLITAASLFADPLAERRVRFLGKVLSGTFAAEGKVYLMMNARKDGLGEIKLILPGLKSPTIQALSDRNYVSVATVVEENRLNSLIFELSELGASGFVILPPLAII